MTEFLNEIINFKKRELCEKKEVLSFSQLYKMTKEIFTHSLFSHAIYTGTGIIAEIKRASPSKGIFVSEDKIEELGKIYQKNKASAISIVTEKKYFLGDLNYLSRLRKFIKIPILRKDFIFDEYQILESKILGADAVLLIKSILIYKELKQLLQLIKELKMEALVEIHSKEELDQALEAEAKIIGINNRNLKTLNVDMHVSQELLPLIPKNKIRIVESGIRNEKDLVLYKKLNVNGFLIGEAFLTSSDPGEKLKLFNSILERK